MNYVDSFFDVEDSSTIDFKLRDILQIATSRKKPVGVAIITLRYDGFSVTAKCEDNMAYTLPNDHKVQVKISYLDAKGNPAAVDGPVVWSSSNEQVLTVAVDLADSTLATVLPANLLSQAQVVATADADVGEGVKQIITTMDVTVVAGMAVSGTIAPVGAPVPITP
jgi:hypothetical protein